MSTEEPNQLAVSVTDGLNGLIAEQRYQFVQMRERQSAPLDTYGYGT